MQKRLILLFGSILLWIAPQAPAQAQSGADRPAQSAGKNGEVPVMDGGAGPCSIDLTIIDPDGKPVYVASVKVHIAYGFAGVRKLDLQAGTNSDGKLKFTGIPNRVHRPPLEFGASKDDLQGIATDDPATECKAKHEIRLIKRTQTEGQ